MNSRIAILIWFCAGCAYSEDPSWQEHPAIAQQFQNAGVKGTFVLYNVAEHRLIGNDRPRAETRFRPASTFKIPNSLIGLSVGAVKDTEEILPYGGKPQPIKAWQRDMSLRDAIQISNVPIYQELARRIGLNRMREQVIELGYGNGEIGKKVDRFWLDGPLKISAVEQTQFLADLAQDRIPMTRDVQAKVRAIVPREEGKGWVLQAKTGWATGKPGVGWWVGWILKEDQLYTFAVNIDMPRKSDAAKRVLLGKASLKILGIIEGE